MLTQIRFKVGLCEMDLYRPILLEYFSKNLPIILILFFIFSGFMHAHVSYLTDDCPACLLMLTVERDAFFELSAAKQKIVTVKIHPENNSSLRINTDT